MYSARILVNWYTYEFFSQRTPTKVGSNLKLDTVSLTMGEKNYLSLINLFLLQEHSHENSSDGEIVCQNRRNIHSIAQK